MRYTSAYTRRMNRKLNLQKKYCHWHSWFAWYPVTIGKERAWLETVQRKMNSDWLWHYYSWVKSGSTNYENLLSYT